MTHIYQPSGATIPTRSQAVKRLIQLGLIPAECTRFELVFDVHKPIRATCTFNVTEEQLEKVVQAYEENPAEASQVILEFIRPGTIKIGSDPDKEDAWLPDLEF